MNKIVILGSTGSIGTQNLDIIKELGDYKVVGLCCAKNIELLDKEIQEFKPLYVYTMKEEPSLYNKYKEIKFFYGEKGLKDIASLDDYDTLLNALVGSVGLVPTLEAIKHHKKVLLANKETLVIGGELVKEYLKKYNGTLYPIDSEHSSLWMLLDKYGKENITDVTITASGGPFFDYPLDKLDNVKIEDALNHPNWKMGRKITIDSATMMNKGFEIIEAYYLFDYPLDKIHAVINRKSIVHAMVKLKDGETKMLVDAPSMRNPIIRALYYPRIRYELKEYDESEIELSAIDFDRFPSISLAYEAIKKGGLYPTVLNASNEASVSLFLDGKIKFTDIYKINKSVLDDFKSVDSRSLENILKYDKIIKDLVKERYS